CPSGQRRERCFSLRLGQPVPQWRAERPRPDRVDSDGGQLAGQAPGQALARRRAGRRERAPWRRAGTDRPRGERHRPARPYPRRRVLDRDDLSPEPDFEALPGLAERQVRQRPGRESVAGGVDEGVQRPDPGEQIRDRRLVAPAARAVASPMPELPPMMTTRWLARDIRVPPSDDSLRHHYSHYVSVS